MKGGGGGKFSWCIKPTPAAEPDEPGPSIGEWNGGAVIEPDGVTTPTPRSAKLRLVMLSIPSRSDARDTDDDDEPDEEDEKE